MSDVALVLVVVLVIVLIWRGPKTLPDLGRALGRGIREARKAATGAEDEESDTTAQPPEGPPPPKT